MRAAAWFACVALSGLACATERLPPPPSAPQLQSSTDWIPPDLDAVVRVDVPRTRATLGPLADRLFFALIATWVSRSDDHATRELLAALVARSNAVWVGARPASRFELSDNVWVFRGRFRDVVPNTLRGAPAWKSPTDLGALIRRYERDETDRASPAVLYVQPERAVVGSRAEIDALERRIERGVRDRALQAPERGLVSLAARVEVVQREVQLRAPPIARVFEGAVSVEAIVERREPDLELTVDVRYADVGRAQQVAAAVTSVLREGAGEDSVKGAAEPQRFQLQSVERSVTLRIRFSAQELAALATL